MKTNTNNLKTQIYFIFVLVVGFLTLVFMHEQVHIQIYNTYNIPAHIELQGLSLVTIADSPCPTEMCAFTHNINEIIWYHLQIFYIVFGIWALLKLD